MADQRESEQNDSPIEQVRLTVPITDDPSLPALTFRTWILGPILCSFLAFTTRFFDYRRNPVFISSNCFQMLLLPIGKLMAAILPSKAIRIPWTKWSFSMNPGPFNIKEHVLVSTFANSGLENPYGLTLLPVMKVFYHRKINFFAALFMTQTTQLMGYGFAGIFMKFLVNSPFMWWPFTLIDVSFYRALHESELRPKGQLRRLQFLVIVTISSFAYAIVPNYFFPSISTLSFICLIWKDSFIAQHIGSGRYGLGIGSFGFDWSTVAGFLGNPLGYPLFSIVNTLIGFILIYYLITPIAYWTNSFDAKRFPFTSFDLFDYDGHVYNVSRILNEKDLKFDPKGYQSYSKIYTSTVFLYVMGFSFASITASITHFALFYGRESWNQVKQAYGEKEQTGDVHNRLMKKYNSIPQWWFYAILVLMVGLAIFTCEGFGKQLQLPYWGVLLACLLIFILILPFGVLQATTGQSLNLSLVTELIIGYLYPGKPVANLVFKSYGLSSMFHALSFVYDFKLCHYMKIPPKSMFIAQVTGTILNSVINFATAWWLLSKVKNICDVNKLPEGSQWTCPGEHVVYVETVIWGVVGPSHIFASHGLYSKMYYFFLVGMVAPPLVWALTRLFPEKKWIGLVNFPLIFAASISMPASGAVNYWSWLTVGLFFNFFVYSKYRGWWAKYNYVVAVGLDLGVSFLVLLTSLTLQLRGIYGMQWWGLDVGDHCPLAKCPTATGVQVDGCPVF